MSVVPNTTLRISNFESCGRRIADQKWQPSIQKQKFSFQPTIMLPKRTSFSLKQVLSVCYTWFLMPYLNFDLTNKEPQQNKENVEVLKIPNFSKYMGFKS